MTVVIMGFSPITTKILNRAGPRPLMIFGPLLTAVGLSMLWFITVDSNYFPQVLPALVVMGVGLSMLFVPVQNLALIGVKDEDAGVASAVINSVFHIDGSLGLAIFTVVYANAHTGALDLGIDELAAFTDGYKAAFIAAGATMLAAAVTGFSMIRGKKDDLMPTWGEEEEAEYGH